MIPSSSLFFLSAANSGSRQRLKSSGLSGHPCFTPFLQRFFFVVPFIVEIFVDAPVYVSLIIAINDSGDSSLL